MYEFIFDVQVYTTSYGNIQLISNDRYNMFIRATTIPSDGIWKQITNPYLRPINAPFGPEQITCRLILPTSGNIQFSLALQGDSGDNGYLGCTDINAIRLGDIA